MMIKRCKPLSPKLFIIALSLTVVLSVKISFAYDQGIPFSTGIQLITMTYSYAPSIQTITKTYTLKNISGQVLPKPRLVNLFLWSNNIFSTSYLTIEYNGSSYSNIDQTATVSGDGAIIWSQAVSPYPLNSTVIFPALQVQSTESNVSYPYVKIPVADYMTGWAVNEQALVTVTFSSVGNCNWIQNMVYVIYDAGGGPPPTVIELSLFQAYPSDGTVDIIWKTESEIDTAGFNIYRSAAGLDEMEKINDAIIPANGSATSGAEYIFTDSGVRNGVTYTYILEDVDTSGAATRHGPVKATPRWIYTLFHH